MLGQTKATFLNPEPVFEVTQTLIEVALRGYQRLGGLRGQGRGPGSFLGDVGGVDRWRGCRGRGLLGRRNRWWGWELPVGQNLLKESS